MYVRVYICLYIVSRYLGFECDGMASSTVDDRAPHEHLIRLEPLPVDCLPARPALKRRSSEGEGRPTLLDFAREVLRQGDSVIRSLLVAAARHDGRIVVDDPSTRHPPPPPDPPSTSWVHAGWKSDGQTPIHIFRRRVDRVQLAAMAMAGSNRAIARPPWDPNRRHSKGETWLARVSVHDDAPRSDTAPWAEFVQSLKYKHAEHQREYTPDIYASHQVLEWDIPPDTVVDHFVEIEMRGASSAEMLH